MKLHSNLRRIYLQPLTKFESKLSSVLSRDFIKLWMDSRFFRPTYSIAIAFYWTRTKIILTSPVINLWKESSIQEIRYIIGISLNDEDPALAKKRYGWLSLSLCRIYTNQDFLPWPWLKPNINHEHKNIAWERNGGGSFTNSSKIRRSLCK